MVDLFFGEEVDLRDEIGREEREAVAKEVCLSGCQYRFSCLEYALRNNQKWGVWGGMSPGDRREFKSYLRRQGYDTYPSSSELRLNVHHWDGHDGSGPVVDRDRHVFVEIRYAPVGESEDRDFADEQNAQAS